MTPPAGPMDWRVWWDTELGVVRLESWGVVDVDRIVLAFLDITLLPEWQPGLPILADHRQLDVAGMGYEDMKRIVEQQRELAQITQHSRIATVVSSLAHYGLTRMWTAMTDAHGRIHHGIFMDWDEGVAWILDPSAATGDAG